MTSIRMGPHRRLLFDRPRGSDKQPAELLDGKGICHAGDVVADRTVYALLQADLLKVGGEGYTSFGFGCLLFDAMLPLLTLCCRFSLDLFAKRACRRNCFLQHALFGGSGGGAPTLPRIASANVALQYLSLIHILSASTAWMAAAPSRRAARVWACRL